jgi:malate dehydrogenase (oxaloacetate-decarboxylating)(NADP+)
LSNPTSKVECNADEACAWTKGKCFFSSGSPFAPVTLSDGQKHVPGQGNNACLHVLFPGIGLGVLAAGSTKITDHDMLIAAKMRANQVTQYQLDVGCLHPPLSEIRSVSSKIAVEVAQNACATAVATNPKPDDMLAHCLSLMHDPFDLERWSSCKQPRWRTRA